MPKKLSFLVVLFIALSSFAHSFHVGLAYADYEEEKEMLFCTLQLEFNDFEHWLEELGLGFNLEEINKNGSTSKSWGEFEQFIKKHFGATSNLAALDFQLYGVELELDGRFFVYLYAVEVKPFDNITWTFSLLMGHSMEQQNKLEFKYITREQSETHFAYFFENKFSQVIKTKTN